MFVFVKPVLIAVQFVPLSDERNIPASVPAKIVVPLLASEPKARDVTFMLDNPEFARLHVIPLSVERKTPEDVPANTFVPYTAREKITVAP